MFPDSVANNTSHLWHGVPRGMGSLPMDRMKKQASKELETK